MLPVNDSINVDELGQYSPWIELYNDSAATLDLGGMFLTDDLAVPNRWEIPQGTELCSDCWILIWADAGDIPMRAPHAAALRPRVRPATTWAVAAPSRA